MLINELFTSPQTQLGNPDYSYPIKALSSNDNHMRAIVRAGKRWMEIEFARISHREDPRVLEISFEVDGSQDRTGGGDAVAIFNTVLVAINHFLQHNLAPDFFIFAAEGSSRVSLYKRMLSRFLARVGYTSAGYDDLPISVQDNWWQGGSGADVFINDSPILTSPDGSFSDKVLLANGINQIKVSARNKFGKEASKTIIVDADIGEIKSISPTDVRKNVFDGVEVQVAIGDQATYITVKADNKDVFRGTMLPGTKQLFAAKESIKLTTGNAGSTNLKVTNLVVADKSIGSLGSEGETKQDIIIAKDTNVK